jgi:hypothetical protein
MNTHGAAAVGAEGVKHLIAGNTGGSAYTANSVAVTVKLPEVSQLSTNGQKHRSLVSCVHTRNEIEEAVP